MKPRIPPSFPIRYFRTSLLRLDPSSAFPSFVFQVRLAVTSLLPDYQPNFSGDGFLITPRSLYLPSH